MLMRKMSNEEDDKDDVIDIDEIHLPNDDENCGVGGIWYETGANVASRFSLEI